MPSLEYSHYKCMKKLPFYIMGMSYLNTDFVKSIGKKHVRVVQVYILLLWMELDIFSDLYLGVQGDFKLDCAE